MADKSKPTTQKDIDDVLSSIDSLLDTATEVEADDLPVLDIDSDSESERPADVENKQTTPKTTKKTARKKAAERMHSANSSSIATKAPATSSKPTTTVQPQEPAPKTRRSSVAKQEKPPKEPDSEKNIGPAAPTKIAATQSKEDEIKAAENVKPSESESKLAFSTIETDFSLAKRDLPVLDEIISEEEMALIAAGKTLPKRVISEKFSPKSTADKIIDLLAIHLSDYNITRLEFEYLHELIDELLEKEKSKHK